MPTQHTFWRGPCLWIHRLAIVWKTNEASTLPESIYHLWRAARCQESQDKVGWNLFWISILLIIFFQIHVQILVMYNSYNHNKSLTTFICFWKPITLRSNYNSVIIWSWEPTQRKDFNRLLHTAFKLDWLCGVKDNGCCPVIEILRLLVFISAIPFSLLSICCCYKHLWNIYWICSRNPQANKHLISSWCYLISLMS